jgi:hypothetical protein
MRPARWALLAAVLCGLLVPGAASAETGSEIEGVWSFKGGAVDIVPVAGGKFEGIVTAQTQFASCPHQVEEHMWTDITLQSDGSYWGLHQWFHAAPECAPNTTPGPTAWRVLHEPNGARRLHVCFSEPGTTQPTISADGAPKEASEDAAHHVTYGCVDSELIAPLPVVQQQSGSGSNSGSNSGSGSSSSSTVESLTLPSAKQCLRPGRFKLRLQEPKYDPFKTVTIVFAGHRVSTTRKGAYLVATLNLKLITKGSFTVKIQATTALGHKLTSKRTYRICTKIKHRRKQHKRG